MSNSVQILIQQIAAARSETDLRLRFMDLAGDLFQAQHWSIALRNDAGDLEQVELRGLPDHFIDYYTQYGVTIDPLRAYVLAHHAPVHEQVLFTEETWKRSDLYVHGCGRQYDHEHALTGPIVGGGKLIGLVNFARTNGTSAFDTQDLMHLSAICAHLSASLAGLRQPRSSDLLMQLSPRERQIARLVAKGLTNAEIGKQLWITQNTVKQTLKRMFRKLNVSARAELAAKLFQNEIGK
jgi:DNA-binding CsgD family transcriptional regulator